MKYSVEHEARKSKRLSRNEWIEVTFKPYDMKMNKNSYLIIFFLFLSLCLANSANAEAIFKINKVNLDISSPEKAVYYFYEAFRLGDDGLLSQVLANDAMLSEFNPDQELTVPNPVILAAEIKKKIVVRKLRRSFGGSIRIGDVLIYSFVKKDKNLLNKDYPGMASIDDKSCFLVRKINNRWLILAVYPDWPSFEEDRGELAPKGVNKGHPIIPTGK